MYMHDAQNLFDAKSSFSGVEWRVDETLDSLKAKIIVVGIEHGNDKRLEELTPFPNEKYGGGDADAYLDKIVQILMPEIKKRYRIKTGSRHTAIAGSSLGGLTSLYAIVKHPDTFGKAMVFSPSLWYSEDIYKMIEEHPFIRGNIYMMAGGSESETIVADVSRMDSLLTKRTRPGNYRKVIIPEGKHNEKLWQKEFPNAYLWLFRGPRFF